MTGSSTPKKESGRGATTPRKDQRKATPRKMTPRKEPGNATAVREHRNGTPRREATNTTPSREQSRQLASTRNAALRKRVGLAGVKKTQTLGVSCIKSREEALGNDVGIEGEQNGLSGIQAEDNMTKRKGGWEGEMPAEAVEEPSILETQLVEREKKMEDRSRALALKEKQLEVREVQVKEKESDMAKSRQNIKNIKNIIDEKLLLSRKLSDMEQELQKERALRKEAENNVQKVALRLEASLFQEGQEKSELMVQCQILGSQLQVLAKEVEMSRETVEALSLEVKKWRRMAQDGRTLNEFFSSKEAKEVRLPNPEPLLEVNQRNEEISDLKASEEMEVGVSGEAGRRKGEALDLLRIQEDDENPKSGSRMDFGEKKVFFQKKIEAEISSPSLRERK